MAPFLFFGNPMRKSTTFIYYPPGAYGTFIEYCLNYFTDPEFTHHLVFGKTGSAHDYLGCFFTSVQDFESYKRSKFTVPFARLQPGGASDETQQLLYVPNSFNQLLNTELEILSEVSPSIVVLYYTEDSWIWWFNNSLTKTNLLTEGIPLSQATEFVKLIGSDSKYLMTDPEEKLRNIITDSFDKDTIKQWNVGSVDELAIWQLRELLSLALPTSLQHGGDSYVYEVAKNSFPNAQFIEISELRDNFKSTIINLISHLELTLIREDELDDLYTNWMDKQYHAFKDREVTTIVDHLKKHLDYDWSEKNITLLDEIFIQYYLRQSGIEIACYNLNQLPTNTKEFLPLLRK